MTVFHQLADNLTALTTLCTAFGGQCTTCLVLQIIFMAFLSLILLGFVHWAVNVLMADNLSPDILDLTERIFARVQLLETSRLQQDSVLEDILVQLQSVNVELTYRPILRPPQYTSQPRLRQNAVSLPDLAPVDSRSSSSTSLQEITPSQPSWLANAR